LREAQGLALIRKAAFGYRETPLGAAELEVIAGEFSNHADLHVVKVRFERLVLGASRRYSVANPSEQVGFPESVKPSAKGIDGATLIAEAGNLLFTVLVGCLYGYGRVAVQFSIVKSGARLSEPGARDSNAVV
jgi:hypothetical protein